jgi:hypothetical protein
MSDQERQLYHSENGDRWFLCRDDDGRVSIWHKADVSSGGTATKIELGDFLRRGNAGPEHQALTKRSVVSSTMSHELRHSRSSRLHFFACLSPSSRAVGRRAAEILDGRPRRRLGSRLNNYDGN